DPLIIDDKAGVSAGRADALADSRQRLVERAGRDVGLQVCADTCAALTSSFEREAEGAPVGLAGDVVVDAGEADAFEPPRGSWAHVSLRVVAVDDHRPFAVGLLRPVAVGALWRGV